MDAITRREPTVVGTGTGEKALLWGGFPALGMVAGMLLERLAGWAATLPWVPFQGPLRLIASLPEPWGTLVPIAVGAVAGLVLAFIGHQESLTVAVTGESVTLRRGESTREISAAAVDAAFVDAKHLVLLGSGTTELAREQTDARVDRLREAFTAHGYTWYDADPHREEFRPWVEDSPDLPAAAHALLKARRRALEKDRKNEAADLRDELAALGVVVKQHDKRQHWRRVER